jgi:protein tyrosine/serine phosphatase
MVVVLGVLSVAQVKQSDNLSGIRIKNFGCVNENYYRGAQPEGRDYADLAALGVKTIIDVHEHGPKGEQQMAERAGLKFYRIPLNEMAAPTPEQAAEFLKLVNDPENQPVFVHCAGGRHRTGTLTAIYRETHDGWTADQAFEEMKRYEFLKNGDHSRLKDFVYDYHSNIGKAASVGK